MSQDLRDANLKHQIVKTDPNEWKNLDGSIKKNTAFIKKLKAGVSKDNVALLTKDIMALKLEKYISEVASALVESCTKLKSVQDFQAAVELCSILHQRFLEFTDYLSQNLLKQLEPPPSSSTLASLSTEQREKEESARLARQKSVLRLFVELYIAGVFIDPSNNLLIPSVLSTLFDSDHRAFLNLSLAVYFAKSFGEGMLIQEQPSSDDKDSNKARFDFLPESVKKGCTNILKKYFESLCRVAIREQQKAVRIQNSNREFFIAKGEVFEDRQEKYEKAAKIVEKLLANARLLAEILGLPPPNVEPLEESSPSTSIGISDQPNEKSDQQEVVSLLWEDDESRQFYENLVDLTAFVPAIFLSDKKSTDKTKKSDDKIDDSVISEGAEETQPNEKEETQPNEKEEKQPTEKEEATDEGDGAQNPAVSSVALDNLLTKLSGSLNKTMIDQLAIDFCYLNSKSARKRLISTLVGVSRQRLDLLPLYSRLIATLSPHYVDIRTSVIDALEAQFHYQRKKKEQVFMEERIKNIRFLGELVKFKLLPQHTIFHCMKVLLDDFVHHNIDVLASFLETCGRFLFKSEDTAQRTSNMLDIMMRKKTIQNLDNRQKLVVENAYYQCNPPDRPACSLKKRTPIESYIRKLIYVDLCKKNFIRILKSFRKMDWKDASTVTTIRKVFCKIHKVKFSNIHLMAYLVSELSRYHPELAILVVDHTLEEGRVGLERNLFKHNQRRIANVHYLGELYNYRVIDHNVIFEFLYLVLRFGHEGGLYRPNMLSELDAPYDYFRIRLCCALLDTCGHCFDKGMTAKKLDQFLLFFQIYYTSKPAPPRDVEYLFYETVESLRPSIKVAGSVEEALEHWNNAITQDSQVERDEWEEDNVADKPEDQVESDLEEEIEQEEVIKEQVVSKADDEDEDMDSEEEDDANEDNDDSAESDEDEGLKLDEIEAALAEQKFEMEYAKMMQESLESRKYEKRPAVFDVAIPTRAKVGAYDRLDKEQPLGSHVEFTLLTKKGAKKKTIELPTGSAFVASTLSKKEAEQEEKMQLKKLVLNYEVREREETKVAQKGDVIYSNMLRRAR